MEENKKPDDGSLAFLNIPRDESNRSFNCDETTQSKLVNTSFWVCDFIEDVPTRFSKIKGNYQIFPVAKNRYDRHGRALDYVGYKFFREQKLMRKSIKQNFCREAARLNKREKPLSQKAYKQAVCPWLGWAKHSNSRHLLKTIIKQKYYGIL